jgi:hypothetical protein
VLTDSCYNQGTRPAVGRKGLHLRRTLIYEGVPRGCRSSDVDSGRLSRSLACGMFSEDRFHIFGELTSTLSVQIQ